MALKTKKTTLKDIAAAAGVSMTSASMYINGCAKKYHLSDAACKRIKDAIDKLQYVPNIHARAIAKKKTLLIGTVIASGLETSFWLHILSGIERTIIKDNYHMILSVSHGNHELELENIKFMLNKGVDGLLITPAGSKDPNLDYLKKLNLRIPVVTMNKYVESLSGAFNDNYRAGEIVAEHLINNGHRRIAYIGPPGHPRTLAFTQKLHYSSLEFSGFTEVSEFMERVSDFTAVFCFCDYIALDLYKKAASCNINIPEDLSIVGFDNMDFAELTTPRLTTIDQYKKEIGIGAAEILMDRLKGNNLETVHKRFMPELRTGASVRKISSR